MIAGIIGFSIVTVCIVYVARPSLSLTTDLTVRDIIGLSIVGLVTAVLMLWFAVDIPTD